MIHGGLGYIRNGRLFVSYELLRPLSIGHQTRLFGIYYPSKYEACTVKHDFVLSPIPHRLWPRIGRYIIRIKHDTTAIKEISNLLSKRNISILFSDAIRSGYRFDTWNLTVAFESLGEGNTLQYEANASIYKETLEKIREAKSLIESEFADLLFKDEKDIQLKESVIDIPHTALPYFHQEFLSHEKEIAQDSWHYKPFSVEYDENEGAIISDSEQMFSAIIGSIFRTISTENECLVFVNTDVRDMTIRTAIIPTPRQRHLFEARYDYERIGTPDTSRGILAHVLSRLPHDYSVWKMTNRTRTSSPHLEKGSTTFILEDQSSSDTDCVNQAQSMLEQIKSEPFPSTLEHLHIVDVNVKPLSVNRIISRLEAEKDKRHVYDVFLSYSSVDEVSADKVQSALKNEGLRCFMASKELEGGELFSEKIRKALLESRETCILFTPNAKDSEWVATEWGAAWALGKTTVPILLRTRPPDLPERLRVLQCRDFHQLSEYVSEVVRRQERNE